MTKTIRRQCCINLVVTLAILVLIVGLVGGIGLADAQQNGPNASFVFTPEDPYVAEEATFDASESENAVQVGFDTTGDGTIDAPA